MLAFPFKTKKVEEYAPKLITVVNFLVEDYSGSLYMTYLNNFWVSYNKHFSNKKNNQDECLQMTLTSP